jgi:hypothetical protein
MMNGDTVKCISSCQIMLALNGVKLKLDCLVAEVLPGYQMLLGMDAVAAMGGVRISGDSKVIFERDTGIVAAADVTDVEINDEDFSALFHDGKWTVKWKWRLDDECPLLKNNVAQYQIPTEAHAEFDKEVSEWIRCG